MCGRIQGLTETDEGMSLIKPWLRELEFGELEVGTDGTALDLLELQILRVELVRIFAKLHQLLLDGWQDVRVHALLIQVQTLDVYSCKKRELLQRLVMSQTHPLDGVSRHTQDYTQPVDIVKYLGLITR